MLTSTLPSLARATSDDDLLSTDLDGEGGSLDDLSSKQPQQQSAAAAAGGGGELPHYHHDAQQPHHAMADNVSRRTVDSDCASTASNTVVASRENSFPSDGDGLAGEPVAVSYNLREQNIDYIQQTPPPQPPSRQQQRWSGSQQNLHFAGAAAAGAAAGTASSNYPSGSELQRQKPLAVRSMSGGYETAAAAAAVVTSSNSSGAMHLESMAASAAAARARTHAPAKRQSSLDDEPIMV